MTNEEAKKIIFNQWQSFLEDNIDYGGISEAYKMAIRSLETQPCEDCISRNTLERVICALTYWHPTTDGRLEVGGAFDNTVYKVEDVWRLIRVLPPVTPQLKIGHWEDCSNGWMCSNCYKDVSHESDFCPHCGADMRGETK